MNKKILMLNNVFVSFLIFAATCFCEVEKKTFETDKIKSVNISNYYGNVTVIATNSKIVEVKVEKVNFDDKCKMLMEIKDSNLSIKAERKYLFSRYNYVSNIVVTVPKNFDVSVNTGSGNLEIKGIKGNVDFTVGNGHVVVNGDCDLLNGNLGNGNFDFVGSSENTYIKIANGNSKFVYTRCPVKGILKVKEGNGNVEVFLPTSSKIALDFNSQLGALKNEIELQSVYGLYISVKTGMGNLSIKEFNQPNS